MIYFDEDDVEGLGQAFLEALARRNSQRTAFRVGGNVGRRMCKTHPSINFDKMEDECYDSPDLSTFHGTVAGCGGGSICGGSTTVLGGCGRSFGLCGGSSYGSCGRRYGHC